MQLGGLWHVLCIRSRYTAPVWELLDGAIAACKSAGGVLESGAADGRYESVMEL